MLSFSPASLTGCLSFVVPGSLFWETFYYLLSFMAIPDLCTSEQTEDDVFLKAVKQTSLAVQWLRLHTCNAGREGLIPGQGTNIPHAMQPKKYIKK